jgi:hypothetical protein
MSDDQDRAMVTGNRGRAVEGWFPLVAGLVWLMSGIGNGGLGLVVALAPGVLLTATGAAELLFSGDRRILQFAALGGVGGVLLAVVEMMLVGIGTGLALGIVSAAAFVAAGHASLRVTPLTPRVPEAAESFMLAAKVAVDEALLSTMGVGSSLPTPEKATRIRAEIDDALSLFRDRGWLEKPESYHRNPLPLEAPRLERSRSRGIDFEHLSFESEYEPHGEEPGRERWLGYTANRTAHAWVLRHAGGPRPWLVCIHGYQMGTPLVDLSAFDPGYYHQKLGLNLALPVLPLHGKRKIGRRSGDGFLSGNALDTIHAEAQAMWDIRRLLSWIRGQDAPAVGVMGLSLGGYNTALLASLDSGLTCAIAGIPATDFSRLLFEHSQPSDVSLLERAGLTHEVVRDAFRVISPLVLEPKVAHEGRAIFGGIVDRLVPPDQVRDLHEHWDEPQIAWYPGGHMTFVRDAGVKSCIHATLQRGGLVAA